MPILHGFLMQRRDRTGCCEFKARGTFQVFFVCLFFVVLFFTFCSFPTPATASESGAMSLQVELS